MHRFHKAFTLVELLVVIGITALIAVFALAAVAKASIAGKISASMANLKQLAAANMSYAADNDGQFCPAMERKNRKRWHGERASSKGKFDAAKGFLSPYLGGEGRVKTCPLFSDIVIAGSFEEGTGGYGYNAAYVGGTPSDTYTGARISDIPRPAQTVMFATTAFAKAKGVQEYAFAEPYYWVDPNNNMGGALQPSVHFRANGKALIAWCDGHVTAELPEKLGGTDYYAGDSEKQKIGWVGPSDNNGYWNPEFQGE